MTYEQAQAFNQLAHTVRETRLPSFSIDDVLDPRLAHEQRAKKQEQDYRDKKSASQNR